MVSIDIICLNSLIWMKNLSQRMLKSNQDQSNQWLDPCKMNDLGFLELMVQIFRSSVAEWLPALSLRCIVKTVGDPLS